MVDKQELSKENVGDGLLTYFSLAGQLDKVNVTGVSKSVVRIRTADELKSEIEALVEKYTSEPSSSDRKVGALVEKYAPSSARAVRNATPPDTSADTFVREANELTREADISQIVNLEEARLEKVKGNYLEELNQRLRDLPRVSKMRRKPSRSKLDKRVRRLQKSLKALNSPKGIWGVVYRAFKGHDVSTYSGAVKRAASHAQSAVAAIDKLQTQYHSFLYGSGGLHNYAEAYGRICFGIAHKMKNTPVPSQKGSAREVGSANFRNEKQFMETGTELMMYDKLKTTLERSIEIHEDYLFGLTQLKASLQKLADNLNQSLTLQKITGYNSLALAGESPSYQGG